MLFKSAFSVRSWYNHSAKFFTLWYFLFRCAVVLEFVFAKTNSNTTARLHLQAILWGANRTFNRLCWFSGIRKYHADIRNYFVISEVIFWYRKLFSNIRKVHAFLISEPGYQKLISDIRNYFLKSEIIFWYQKIPRFLISEINFWYQKNEIPHGVC